jgi:hypothetical protein
MQTDTLSAKVMYKVGDVVTTFLVAMGTVAFTWILAFLIVSLLDK